MGMEQGMTAGSSRWRTGAPRWRAGVMVVALGGAALLVGAAPASAHHGGHEGHRGSGAACQVTAASVDGGTARFTVGPRDCVQPTGLLSFSTYSLPSGFVQPFAEQVRF